MCKDTKKILINKINSLTDLDGIENICINLIEEGKMDIFFMKTKITQNGVIKLKGISYIKNGINEYLNLDK